MKTKIVGYEHDGKIVTLVKDNNVYVLTFALDAFKGVHIVKTIEEGLDLFRKVTAPASPYNVL